MKPTWPGNTPPDALGAVAGRAAEEIGTALTAIQMAVDRLARQAEEEGCSVHERELTVIRGQSQRLAVLARNLLGLAGSRTASPVPTDLREAVARMISPFQAEAGRLGIELTILGEGPVEVHADPTRLREVLQALLHNALAAAASACGPNRWVAVQVEKDGEGNGVLRIQDSGPGVAPGAEEAIFLPFVSGWGQDGMGLSLARISVAEQGGTLRVGEESGATEFVLTLRPPGEGPEGVGTHHPANSPDGERSTR